MSKNKNGGDRKTGRREKVRAGGGGVANSAFFFYSVFVVWFLTGFYILYCSQGYPRTHHVAQVGLKLVAIHLPQLYEC